VAPKGAGASSIAPVIATGGPIAPAVPTPLMPSGCARRGLDVVDLDIRQVGGAEELVVREAVGEELAVLAVDQLLEQGVADPWATPPATWASTMTALRTRLQSLAAK
jgi:hypothetical protein